MSKRIKISQSRTRIFERHHDDCFVGEIAVAERLLESTPPVLELALKCVKKPFLKRLLNGKRREVLSSQVGLPSNPNQICHTKTRQGKLTRSHPFYAMSSKVRPLKSTHEV